MYAVMIALAAGAVSVQGGKPSETQAPIFKALVDCKSLSDKTQRLACYDSATDALAAAEKTGDVVIADKAQIKQSKRALFGFGTIRLPILGNSDSDQPTQIESTISSVRSIGYNRWEFTLADGMRWRQTDDELIFPASGQSVVVKSAAFGSYMMKIKSKAVRVIRVP